VHYYLYFGLRGEKYIYLKSNTSGEGNGNPLQYSWPEKSHGQRAWWVTVHRVAKNQIQLSDRAQSQVYNF